MIPVLKPTGFKDAGTTSIASNSDGTFTVSSFFDVFADLFLDSSTPLPTTSAELVKDVRRLAIGSQALDDLSFGDVDVVAA